MVGEKGEREQVKWKEVAYGGELLKTERERERLFSSAEFGEFLPSLTLPTFALTHLLSPPSCNLKNNIHIILHFEQLTLSIAHSLARHYGNRAENVRKRT